MEGTQKASRSDRRGGGTSKRGKDRGGSEIARPYMVVGVGGGGAYGGGDWSGLGAKVYRRRDLSRFILNQTRTPTNSEVSENDGPGVQNDGMNPGEWGRMTRRRYRRIRVGAVGQRKIWKKSGSVRHGCGGAPEHSRPAERPSAQRRGGGWQWSGTRGVLI